MVLFQLKKNFSTGAWYKIASKKIKQINKKGKIALVVGGTGLYFKTLTDGFSEIPKVPKGNKNINISKANYICKGVNDNFKYACYYVFLVLRFNKIATLEYFRKLKYNGVHRIRTI